MAETYSVPLSQVVSQFELEVAYRSTDYEKIQITVADVARPGLQIAGYYDHFEPMRLQVIGNVESSYLDKMTAPERTLVYDRLFSYKIPALIAARGLLPGSECLEMARKHNITILLWPGSTSSIVSSIIAYLTRELAPRVTRHGVLMEIYGEGVLLIGESGIGKSETAVELIKRGHRLIADDAVEIKRVNSASLMGCAPPLIQNYIELRGIGIINVANLFGAGSVKDSTNIDLVVDIVPWDTRQVYDRLGLEDHFYELLGVKVPLNTIPVTPGRNLAVILEVAAMNNRQRRMGYNAAQEFTAQINKHLMQSIYSRERNRRFNGKVPLLRHLPPPSGSSRPKSDVFRRMSDARPYIQNSNFSCQKGLLQHFAADSFFAPNCQLSTFNCQLIPPSRPAYAVPTYITGGVYGKHLSGHGRANRRQCVHRGRGACADGQVHLNQADHGGHGDPRHRRSQPGPAGKG